MIHRRLDWQDGVEVIAVPLHTVSVDVAGILHHNELSVRQLCDTLHRCRHCKMHCKGDGEIAGIALMRVAVFAVEQIGIDGDGSVTNVQKNSSLGRKNSC